MKRRHLVRAAVALVVACGVIGGGQATGLFPVEPGCSCSVPTFPRPANTALPTVSGTPSVGSSLSVTNGTWTQSPTAYSYKWQSSATGTSGWTDITAATSASYTVASGDNGRYLRSEVSARNANGFGAPADSASTVQVTGGGGGGSSTGNVFIETNGGSCTRSASLVSYVDANACGSLDAAYQAASLGDTVLIESGTYASQSINSTSKVSGACDGYTVGAALTGCVTFQPDSGATVTFSGDIKIDASYVRLKNLTFGTVYLGCINTVTDLVADNVTAGHVGVHKGATNVGILGGSYGPNGSQAAVTFAQYDCGNGTGSPSHVRLDGASVHDVRQCHVGDPGCADPHIECMQTSQTDYLTVRNTKFVNCDQGDLQIGFNATLSHELIENNFFGPVCANGADSTCRYVGELQQGCTSASHDIVLRFNTLQGSLSFSNYPCTFTGSANYIMGNIVSDTSVSSFLCSSAWQGSGFNVDYNVLGSGSVVCGSHGQVESGEITSSTSPYNWHLASCARVAANLVPTSVGSGFPSTDYFGVSRPVSPSLDAGASEDC